MKKFINEFRKFIARGNVIDLAVGVIIGAAFQAIVKSLTDDILSPIIGMVAKTDFSDWMLTVNGVNIRYGSFVTAVIQFLIMAFVIFMIVKIINIIKDKTFKKEPEAPKTKKCPYCFSDIDIKATRCPHCTSVIEEAITGNN